MEPNSEKNCKWWRKDLLKLSNREWRSFNFQVQRSLPFLFVLTSSWRWGRQCEAQCQHLPQTQTSKMDFNLSEMNSKQLSPLPWNIILDRGRMFILKSILTILASNLFGMIEFLSLAIEPKILQLLQQKNTEKCLILISQFVGPIKVFSPIRIRNQHLPFTFPLIKILN